MESTLTSEVLEISSVQIAAVRENVELLVQDTVVSTHPLLPMDLRTANDAIEIFSEYVRGTSNLTVAFSHIHIGMCHE